MSIYRTPNSPYWQYDFRIKGRRFHGSTSQTSKTAAKRTVDRLRRELADNNGKRNFSLDEACGHYWTTVAERQPSAKTTRYQINNLLKGLKRDDLLVEIEQHDLAGFAARRRATVSDSSVNRELQLARRIWRHAQRKLKASVSEIEWRDLMFSEPAERVRELYPEDEGRLVAALRSDYRDFFAFMILCGARRSAGINLRWSDIDFHNMTARAIRKGGGHLSIVLTPSMVELIKRQPKVGPFVFTYVCQKNRVQKMNGQRKTVVRIQGERYPITKEGLKEVWRRALLAAGIEDFRFHDLRHTAATRMMRKTGNLKLVQRLLGHSDISSTVRYAHVSDDDLRGALEEVEQVSRARNSPARVVAQSRKL